MLRFGALLALGLLVVSAGATADEQERRHVDLDGTWYVLTYYRDSEPRGADAHDAAAGRDSADLATAGRGGEAAAEREAPDDEPPLLEWNDRVWRFEREGSRLRWTEHAIVRFRDPRGRFETLGDSRLVRSLGAWRPDDRQRAEIASGLRADPRGTRARTLHGSPEWGWTTTGGGLAASRSTSVIGYEETWSIEGLPASPVFVHAAEMGGARAAAVEGRTEFATLEVLDGGHRLRGRYARDGRSAGTFEMFRAGSVAVSAEASADAREGDVR